MIPAYRQWFNEQFSAAGYERYQQLLEAPCPGALDFRVAETPVFIPGSFRQQVLDTCESIVDRILQPDYLSVTEAAIPPHLRVPGAEGQPQFIAFDFGICHSSNGGVEPQLIELQGFPSLFALQVAMDEAMRQQFGLPDLLSTYLNGFDKQSHLALLRSILLGPHAVENVVLLELFPNQQKTRIDFRYTAAFTGIRTVCLTELVKQGNRLYYRGTNGGLTRILRIYNRLIFDELLQQAPAVQEKGQQLFGPLEVEWAPHPNWFYRISKYTLPLIRHPYVPHTRFLHQVDTLPSNLENYVLKPLFSFAGQGVVIDVTPEDIARISDPQNWILQRKVDYAAIIETPDEPSKAEVRIFYCWPPGAARPVATQNLARLSKGKMIGVRYNQQKTWVGGTICYFEP